MNWPLFSVYAFSVLGGWAVCGLMMAFLRWFVGLPQAGTTFSRMVFLIGGTERAIATTLVLWAPGQLALFIGGWIALKMAAGWHSRDNSDENERGSFLALLGNVISFGIAIAAGLAYDQSALAVWNGAEL